MRLNRRQIVVAAFTLASPRTVLPDNEYHFLAGGYLWQMTLEYYDWPSVRQLKFLDRASGRQFCVSGGEHEVSNCMARFVGSVGIARYRITQGGLTKLPRLRERVRTIDRCDRLPERPPYERAIEWENGLASDIQVFGFSGQGAAEGDDAWCIFRQELHLEDTRPARRESNDTPALILHWKHSIKQVRMLDVIASPGRSRA